MDDTERRLAHVEASLEALPRLEEKMDQVVQLAAAMQTLEVLQAEQNTRVNALFTRHDEQQTSLSRIERSVESKLSWVKGAMATATLFWVVLQGIVGYTLQKTLETVAADHDKIVRIEEAHERLRWQHSTLPRK